MKIRLLLLFLLFPLILFCQSVNDTIRIGEVEVFGYHRRPGELGLHSSRPDTLALASHLTASLSELLTFHTPLHIKSYGRGSQATASFRGAAASHTQLLWNGMNLNSPMAGIADLSLLPVFFIDEVTLLYGGSSLSSGSGGLGGAILLESNPSWEKRVRISTTGEAGSFGSKRVMAGVTAGTLRWHSVTRFLFDTSRNNFPFYNVGVIPFREDTLKNGGFRSGGVMQELYLRIPKEVILALRGWAYQAKRDLPQLMSYEGSGRVEKQDYSQWRLQAEMKKLMPLTRVTLRTGINSSEMEYFRKVNETGWLLDDALNREMSWITTLQVIHTPGTMFTLTSTLEGAHHKVNSSNRARDEGYRKGRSEAGLLLHLQYRPSEQTGFFLLNRSEIYESHLIPVIPAAGAEWNFGKQRNDRLKTNLSANFHKPSMNDLYWIPGGNPKLKPEKGVSGEIVWNSIRKKGKWEFGHDLALFISRISDWIIWQPAANGAWYWEASNLKKVMAKGAEFNFNSSFNHNDIKFILSGNYTYTRTTNLKGVSSVDQSRGKQLMYIPIHSGNLHGIITGKGWSFQSDLHHTGRRYTTSSNEWSFFESRLQSFQLLDCSLSKSYVTRHTETQLKLKIENLLDVNYQQILWRPMPGRHYSLTLSLSLLP